MALEVCSPESSILLVLLLGLALVLRLSLLWLILRARLVLVTASLLFVLLCEFGGLDPSLVRVLVRLHLWGGIGEGGLYLPGSPLPLSTSVLVCLLLDLCPKLAEISVGDTKSQVQLTLLQLITQLWVRGYSLG